jgi:hypothetical protein
MRIPKHVAWIAVALALSACSGEPAQVNVSNLAVGLMREAPDGRAEIYERGTTFPLIPNGSCHVDGKDVPCMLYGFEFDYTATKPGETLDCRAEFRKKTTMVNDTRLDKQKSDETTFTITLTEREGRYSQVASVFRQPGDSKEPWRVELSCLHGTREVVRFLFTALNVD